MKKTSRAKKYYAPQDEKGVHMCDCPGCTHRGEFRAPKDRDLKEYYWFCLEHVKEYNSKWNYYDGISDKAPDGYEKPKRKFRFKSNIKYKRGWNLNDDFGFFGEYASDFSAMDDIFYNKEEKRCLELMGLEGKDLDIKKLKKRYKELAKQYHPDTNQGSSVAEEKFKHLTFAYQTLLSKFN